MLPEHACRQAAELGLLWRLNVPQFKFTIFDPGFIPDYSILFCTFVGI